MTHDEYWVKTYENAHKEVSHLFDNCRTKVCDLVEGNKITTPCEATNVLSFILKHTKDCQEQATAVVYISTIVQAIHELRESGGAK